MQNDSLSMTRLGSPEGGHLSPYGRTQVEKGSAYSLPHWDVIKGQASEGSEPQSDLKINEPACMRDWIELNWDWTVLNCVCFAKRRITMVQDGLSGPKWLIGFLIIHLLVQWLIWVFTTPKRNKERWFDELIVWFLYFAPARRQTLSGVLPMSLHFSRKVNRHTRVSFFSWWSFFKVEKNFVGAGLWKSAQRPPSARKDNPSKARQLELKPLRCRAPSLCHHVSSYMIVSWVLIRPNAHSLCLLVLICSLPHVCSTLMHKNPFLKAWLQYFHPLHMLHTSPGSAGQFTSIIHTSRSTARLDHPGIFLL